MNVEEVIEHYRTDGKRITGQRLAVVEALEGDESHPKADQIIERVRQKQPTISAATVYKILGELVEMGEIQAYNFGDGRLRYDPRNDEHSHIFCRSCGSLYDLEYRTYDEVAAINIPGYELVGSNLWYVAESCPRCRNRSQRSSNAPPQERRGNPSVQQTG